MRHFIAILIYILLFKSEVFSQSDSTTVLKDSVRTVSVLPAKNNPLQWFQFTSAGGIAPLPYKSLNDYFIENGFNEIRGFQPTLANGSLYNALDEQIAFKNWNVIIGFAYQRFANGVFNDSSRQQRTEARLTNFDVSLGFGYTVLKHDFFRINPFVSLGFRTNFLTIEHGVGYGDFSDVLNSSYRSMEFQNLGINGDIGVIGEFTVYKSSPDTLQPELPQTEWFLSFKSAYTLGLTATGWRSDAMQLNGGPNVKTNGVRLELGLGFRMIPRFFKAKIISEEKY